MLAFTETGPGYNIRLSIVYMGSDLLVTLSGGDAPHIGAVALAQPRPSLDGNGQTSASCSILTLCGHKEDVLARKTALTMAARTDRVVCVACGIHVDGLDQDGIDEIDRLSQRLLDRAVLALSCC